MFVTPIAQTLVAGAGLTIDQQIISIDSVTQAAITGAVQEVTRNQPNGFAGLDSQSAISGRVKVSYLTSAQADAFVPAAGELIVTSDTKELRYGDNISQGGFSAGLSSTSSIYIPCSGTTAIENGAVVVAAYNHAKTLTPYGQPLSATNRIMILLGIGDYDLNDAFEFDTSFIDLVGLTSQGVRVTVGPIGLLRIRETCLDYRLRNITFVRTGSTYGFQWTFPLATVTFQHENLVFDGTIADYVFSAIAQSAGGPTQANGLVRNVKTQCSRLYSANAGLLSHTWNVTVEDCEAGNSFFGNTSTVNKPIFAGTFRRCKCNATSNNNFEMTAATRVLNCDWSRAMNYCVTGARIEYTTFRTGATASLGGNAAGQQIAVAHSTMAVANHATNPITNILGTDAQAMNVRSDL